VAHRISFAITARDEDPAILTATIEGLLSTSRGRWREILVVDDGSIAPVAFAHPDVVILRNSEPVGVCPSRRKALAAAGGNVLVTLDAHMTFQPDWLDRMLEHVDSRALLCAAWMSYDRSRTYCWGADFAWGRGVFTGFGFRHRQRRPRRKIAAIPMVIGACYMIRRDAYEQLGGFCPLFRVWGSDEQDISIRAWLAGLEVKCVTGAGVGHLNRAALSYPVTWDHSLFNEIVMIRTAFEEPVACLLEEFFAPLSDTVQSWLQAVDWRAWRSLVQSQRRMSDADFFRRYAPDAPLSFRHGVELKRGRTPASRIMAAVEDQERRISRSFAPSPPPAEPGLCAPRDRISFTTFGVPMTIRVNEPSLTGRLLECLPPGACASGHAEGGVPYSLTFEPPNYRFSAGANCLIESADLNHVLKAVRDALQHDVAVEAEPYLFVKAAVVARQGQAILLLGDRMSGARALAAELVAAGAEYYSDTCAVFDARGQVLPYPRPLELAGAAWSAGTPDGSLVGPPLKMGMVVLARFMPGSRTRLRRLTFGKGLQALLANGVLAGGKAARAFTLFGRIGRGIPVIQATYGNAGVAAMALLRVIERRLQ
jgi:hypothetical protein